MNPKDLVGLSEADAIRKIKQAGFRARVKRRDEKSFVGTMDARSDRINLHIDKNKVTKAYIG